MSGSPRVVSSQVAGGYLRLRIWVGIAGERCDPPWWRSGFGTVAGQRFLRDRLFARTSNGATLTALSMAGARHHDRVLPGHGSFHLFRLPPEIETAIDALGRQGGIGTHFNATEGLSLEGIIEQLAASGTPPERSAVGPIRCGGIDLLSHFDGVSRIAGAYAEALRTQGVVVPYFAEAHAP